MYRPLLVFVVVLVFHKLQRNTKYANVVMVKY